MQRTNLIHAIWPHSLLFFGVVIKKWFVTEYNSRHILIIIHLRDGIYYLIYINLTFSNVKLIHWFWTIGFKGNISWNWKYPLTVSGDTCAPLLKVRKTTIYHSLVCLLDGLLQYYTSTPYGFYIHIMCINDNWKNPLRFIQTIIESNASNSLGVQNINMINREGYLSQVCFSPTHPHRVYFKFTLQQYTILVMAAHAASHAVSVQTLLFSNSNI